MSQIKDTYLDAKVSYEILEQQIRQCQDAVLLPGLNSQLKQAEIAMGKLFWAWSAEVDELLNQPITVDPLPQPGLRLVNGWLHDSFGGRTLVLNKDVNQTPGAA